MAYIFATVDSFVVFGAKIRRTAYWNLLMALSGMSTFGVIVPRPPIPLMIL